MPQDTKLDIIERYYLRPILEQIKTDRPVDIQAANVLLVSDRAPGRAKGLYRYFLQKTNVHRIQLVSNYEEAQGFIHNIDRIDFLIYVGYQKNSGNYCITDSVNRLNCHTLVSMFASVDRFIKDECSRHSIDFLYSCEEPIRTFLILLCPYHPFA